MSSRWIVPAAAPSGTRSLVLTVPDGDDWEALARGALALLLDPANYEQSGTITPDAAAEYWLSPLLATFQDWEAEA